MTLRVLALALALVVLGCAKSVSVPTATSAPGAGVAFIDIAKVVEAHPMNSEIAALQDQINALNSQALVAPLASTPQQKQAQAQLQQDLQAADVAFQDELARKRTYYQQQEAQAIERIQEQALGQNGGSPGGVIAGMRQQYGSQLQQMQVAAGKTLADYRAALFKEDADHLRSVQQQLSSSLNARVRAKEQQQSDAETAYQVNLAKADQAQRLNLRAKLENLGLSEKERAQAQSQLQDLDTREQYLIDHLKTKDAAELKTFIAAQNAQAATQFNTERAATQAATNDKLRQRQTDLGTQMQQQARTIGGQFNQQLAQANQSLANNPKVRSDVAHLHDQFQGQYTADANRALDSYKATRKALVDKYSAIAHMQFQDNEAIAAQIDALSAQRRDLYARVVDQIRSIAGLIAQKEGIGIVVDSVRGTNGATDLTDQVARAVAGLPSTTPPPSPTGVKR